MKRLMAIVLIWGLFFSAVVKAETLTLSFVGDCSMGEMFRAKHSPGSYTAVIDEKGAEWPFSLVKPILDQDDLSFANLELVYTKRTRHVNKPYPLVAEPQYAVVLKSSGIDVLNTANNHCMDFYQDGYNDTMKTLEDIGMPNFGTTSLSVVPQNDKLFLQSVKGVMIGAVGVTYPQPRDAERIISRIQRLREQGAQLVIVALHWGREVHKKPESWQISLAKKLVDGGADILWGHHPHILQPMQIYKGKPIFYSTGNFTFGSMSKVDPDTGIFQVICDVNDQGQYTIKQIRVIPCRTQGKGDYRPMLLSDPAEKEIMLKKLTINKNIKGLENPPESFFTTGIWELTAPYTN